MRRMPYQIKIKNKCGDILKPCLELDYCPYGHGVRDNSPANVDVSFPCYGDDVKAYICNFTNKICPVFLCGEKL
jgi:hypothetical protein